MGHFPTNETETLVIGVRLNQKGGALETMSFSLSLTLQFLSDFSKRGFSANNWRVTAGPTTFRQIGQRR